MATKKSYDYQSAFDIIGPVMMGPSSSHTAGAVKIGNAAYAVLGGIQAEKLTIHYYESFAKTHQGHGTDLAIVGGAMGYSTFDSRIKDALTIARDQGIDVEIVEEDGDSIGGHPNCAHIVAEANGRHIEVIGNSIGGGTIKLRRINVEGQEVEFDHGLPILEIDGAANKSEVNHLLNDINELGASIDDELTETGENHSLVVLTLAKAISESTLDQIKDKYSHLNVSYIK
ncbi:serine dehydratase [Staphylococcus devriesei]|uniref:L-serine deaminase n=1 Tax=Staphylococcus devriesei TaxID=586733 RepID=A0A2K4DQW8_9STAP|nr:serine dehydratase beta chain [Staphylococcus devriesei]MCE5090275.1 L-serine ammonia-lyase, iron-sulfur-dependent, subunit beta [Staphylococcus devriesei]PNZ89211.1 serine dehydratase [Staphylococcus devriesei]PTE73532.1 serine dehydratase [Staphylococcus devriesei]PTF04845.1 serine dehydratase [Staphylococcus devriesei]PTF14959.1 serine dehydratase [Staphylococcus devriesei]